MHQTYTLPTTVVKKRKKTILLTPLAVAKHLFFAVLLLLAINVFLFFIEAQLSSQVGPIKVLKRYFDFNTEANIPTLFSSFILFAAAAISLFIYNIELNAINGNKYKKSWILIGLIFILLSFDESCQLHEKLGLSKFNLVPIPADMKAHIPIKWVIPYLMFFLVVGAFLVKFLISLPKRTRNLFFISGFIFLLGAVILEEVGGYFGILYGKVHFYYTILYIIEELLEMCGVIVFIYALLDYVALSHPKILIANNYNK